MSERADPDALRRRLYASDATPEDVARYLDQHPGPPPHAPEKPTPHRKRPRVLLVAVIALAAALSLTLLTHPGARTPAPTPPVQVEDVGEGRVLRVVAGASGPSSRVTTTIRGIAVDGLRLTGRGSAVVRIPRGSGFGTGGRMRVILTAPGAAVRWRALLVVRGDDRTSYPLVVARGVADGPSTAGASGTFVYAGEPPTRVAIEAPARARWTLTVAVQRGLRESSG